MVVAQRVFWVLWGLAVYAYVALALGVTVHRVRFGHWMDETCRVGVDRNGETTCEQVRR